MSKMLSEMFLDTNGGCGPQGQNDAKSKINKLVRAGISISYLLIQQCTSVPPSSELAKTQLNLSNRSSRFPDQSGVPSNANTVNVDMLCAFQTAKCEDVRQPSTYYSVNRSKLIVKLIFHSIACRRTQCKGHFMYVALRYNEERAHIADGA
jgi:hypothetical protein